LADGEGGEGLADGGDGEGGGEANEGGEEASNGDIKEDGVAKGGDEGETNGGDKGGEEGNGEVSFDDVGEVGAACGELLLFEERSVVVSTEDVEEVIASLFILCRCCNFFQIHWHIASS